MQKIAAISSALFALAACGGSNDTNPFLERSNTVGENVTDAETGDSTGTLSDPEQSVFISSGDVRGVRFEKIENDDLTTIDKLYIDNIPFDGVSDLPYLASSAFTTSQDTVGLFRAIATVDDPVNASEILQMNYFALYGKSETGATEFVIVKSDSYIPEGFGGNIIQRNQYDTDGNLVLFDRPADTQAKFTGKYDGFRVQTNGGFITATRGDVEFNFDFDDFDDNPAVYFFATNRKMVGVDGAEIELPDLKSLLQTAGLDETGSFSIEVMSEIEPGKLYENGTISGLLAGEIPMELVGVMTLSSSGTGGFYDPANLRVDGVEADSFVETSGIFAYR